MAGFYNDDPVQAAVDAEEELATAAREAAQAAQAAAESSEAAAAASETAAAASAASASTSASSASTSATNAAISAATASSAETAAGNYSTSAGDSAVSAAASADSATAAAAAASSSKSAAAASAAAAAVSESNAAGSAASASSSESSAADSATAASGSASAAASSAAAASASETAAQNSSIAAGNNAILAINSATAAAASESAAASSASSASTSATNAASSASSAGAAATNAAISEAGAAASGTAAASSETAAALSATDAASSAASAASSEAAASTSAASASSSELSASTSATNAAASETAAAASQAAAATSQIAAAASQTASATSASNASGSEAGALSARASAEAARDEAETHKNNAYTYAQSAASAVAYQDLTAIATTIADTAVDVFVYDTSRDSDGGAWRKRTQHTSWYNETLNTAFRGSRREFPAVAVIVAESDTVTIYDGDDPSLPMWMEFKGGGSTESTSRVLHLNTSNKEATSCSALNGILCVTAEGTGVTRINLISDKSIRSRNGGTYTFLGNISERNELLGGVDDGNQDIVDSNCNDVAMTVLPNAPIDAATGLPVPTIAVATDGGVSVIKDDGAVVDSSDSYAIASVNFDSNNFLWYPRDGGSTQRYSQTYAADGFQGTNWQAATPQVFALPSTITVASNTQDSVVLGSLNTDQGISRLALDPTTEAQSMVAYTTSTYNTGWMNGDIKLATLSDTDDTDLVGSGELVTNGTFDTDVSGWTEIDAARGTVSHDTDKIRLTNDGTGNCFVYQAITTVAGKTYVLSCDATYAGSSTARLSAGSAASSANLGFEFASSSPQSMKVTFTAIGTTTYVQLLALGAAGTASDYATFDNVSVRLAEADRSVNNNGLIVNGTITKDPVATGADLVAYSGFSFTNCLEQPYNADLDFGTGDFCAMSWINYPGTGTLFVFDRQDGSSTAATRFNFGYNQTAIFVRCGSVLTNITTSVPANTFFHLAVARLSGVIYGYVNGVLVGSSANTGSISGTVPTYIGTLGASGGAGVGSLALLRISATAPTAEQIKKIYEDEKVLFQENAQATLYGASDAVTALASDPVTNLLHVGTSAGRSVFQGLRRVDNTTDAVGTAISAVDSLVVEE